MEKIRGHAQKDKRAQCQNREWQAGVLVWRRASRVFPKGPKITLPATVSLLPTATSAGSQATDEEEELPLVKALKSWSFSLLSIKANMFIDLFFMFSSIFGKPALETVSTFGKFLLNILTIFWSKAWKLKPSSAVPKFWAFRLGSNTLAWLVDPSVHVPAYISCVYLPDHWSM